MISDTAFSGNSDELSAFEPVVREIDHIAPGFKSVDWLGYRRYSSPPANHKKPFSNNLTMIVVHATGGDTFKDKISILTHIPVYLSRILSLIEKNNIIYTRGPSVPALLVILVSFFYKNKIFLHKYAGGWDLEPVPFSYSFQKWLLKRQKRGHVLVSAALENDSNCIVSLPNPCLDKDEIRAGYSAMKLKIYSDGLRICFVSNYVFSKGIFDVLDISNILAEENKLTKCTIVGLCDENELRSRLNHRANKLTAIIGVLSREDINQVYANSHFIILPSRSEGFPKVLAEAAAFGCIPVVSKLPGINKIIQNNVNGILLEDLHVEKIVDKLKAVWADQTYMKKLAKNAHEFSKQFSFDSFVHSINHLVGKR